MDFLFACVIYSQCCDTNELISFTGNRNIGVLKHRNEYQGEWW